MRMGPLASRCELAGVRRGGGRKQELITMLDSDFGRFDVITWFWDLHLL